jgi:hypothetical protein
MRSRDSSHAVMVMPITGISLEASRPVTDTFRVIAANNNCERLCAPDCMTDEKRRIRQISRSLEEFQARGNCGTWAFVEGTPKPSAVVPMQWFVFLSDLRHTAIDKELYAVDEAAIVGR